MRYVTYKKEGAPRLGALTDNGIIDIQTLVPEAPATLRGLIAADASMRDRVASAVACPWRIVSCCPLLRTRVRSSVLD